MKKQVFVWLVILTLFLSGCASQAQPTATPGVARDYVPVVSVTGEVVPATWANLSSKGGGEVVDVLVEPGNLVEAGDVLVRLDTTQLEISLQIAQQEAAAQQAVLDALLAGSSELVIARADRDNANQVTQARIALQIQEQQLAQAQAQDPEQDVAAAQARIRQLRSQLAQVRAQDPASEVEVARVELERAKIALDDTQDEYNKALDRPWEDQEIRDAWSKALEQAQLNYRSAQAQLDGALSAQRAHTLSQSTLNAQLEEAEISLAQAQDALEIHQITLDILSDNVEVARVQLAYLEGWDNPYRDPPTDNEVAQVRARVEQAEWSVAQIEQQIADAEVRAPFDGAVGAVHVRAGELIAAGQKLVALGDLETLRVETTDLDEIDIVRVSVGQEVSVTFDSIPEQAFEGRVARISPMAESGSGGVHYTVIVELEAIDPALRWGMTAFVDIKVE